MSSERVGAKILNIITESLYDNPIVVFREYVQNSIDSFLRNGDIERAKYIHIFYENGNLYFFDTGAGIVPELFLDEMQRIGSSHKRKTKNIGYKGIGRLSGVPYCERLTFININNKDWSAIQTYEIDGKKYQEIKESNEYTNMGFSELIEEIGSYTENVKKNTIEKRITFLNEFKINFDDVGFIVILDNIKKVLFDTIADEAFEEKLQWLLPVDFRQELFDMQPEGELFFELSSERMDDVIPSQSFEIFYNGKKLERPIKKESLRRYTCKLDLRYAHGFHSFDNKKITIDRNNSFSGIRLYIDNMLLCDENELLSNLEHFGYLEHTVNGLLQSVKGIGAMIYITDKLSISANARRTFIEVNNDESIELLKLIAEFINRIYEARYALSNYSSAKEKAEKKKEEMEQLKKEATKKLCSLANETVELVDDYDDELGENDKKRIVKKRLTSWMNSLIKEFIRTQEVDLDNVFLQFEKWIKKRNNIG